MYKTRYTSNMCTMISDNDLFCDPLELRWDIFLRMSGAKYTKFRECYTNDDGLEDFHYIFVVNNVAGRAGNTLNIEVITEKTVKHIVRLSNESCITPAPTLYVTELPFGESLTEYIEDVSYRAYVPVVDESYFGKIYEFNFEHIDGDHFGAFPGVNKNGKFEIFGDDLSYYLSMPEPTITDWGILEQPDCGPIDYKATEFAYACAKNVKIIKRYYYE